MHFRLPVVIPMGRNIRIEKAGPECLIRTTSSFRDMPTRHTPLIFFGRISRGFRQDDMRNRCQAALL
jgi:hypothetical protein